MELVHAFGSTLGGHRVCGDWGMTFTTQVTPHVEKCMKCTLSVLHPWLIHLAAQWDTDAKPERYRTAFALLEAQNCRCFLNVGCGGDARSCRGWGGGLGPCQRGFLGVHSLAWDCGAAGREGGMCRDGVSRDRPGFPSLPQSPPWGILQGCNTGSDAWDGQGTPSIKATARVSAQCPLC